MAVCKFEGKPDMYGLGIRLGFYLSWAAAIFAAWLVPDKVEELRYTIDTLVAAVFLSVIILTARDVNSLEQAEGYIMLLLMFGAYLSLIPTYLLRLLTGCDRYWDAARFPRTDLRALAGNQSFVLLIGVLVYQYWFWFARVPGLNKRDCREYGFFFGPFRLNSPAFVAINAILYVFLGLICLYILAMLLRTMAGQIDDEDRPKREISRRHKAAHIDLLQKIDGWIKFVVLVAVIVAIELTIEWNEIEGVGDIDAAAQTISFTIGVVAVSRVAYTYYVSRREEVGEEFLDERDRRDRDEGEFYEGYRGGGPGGGGPGVIRRSGGGPGGGGGRRRWEGRRRWGGGPGGGPPPPPPGRPRPSGGGPGGSGRIVEVARESRDFQRTGAVFEASLRPEPPAPVFQANEAYEASQLYDSEDDVVLERRRRREDRVHERRRSPVRRVQQQFTVG